MTQQKPSPEQEQQLRQLLQSIGPKFSMHIFSDWLNSTAQSGDYGPQYRDSITGVVTSLRDAEQNVRV